MVEFDNVGIGIALRLCIEGRILREDCCITVSALCRWTSLCSTPHAQPEKDDFRR